MYKFWGTGAKMDFDWDDDNVEHLGWHDVEPYEAQEVFYGEAVEYPWYFENGERRQNLVGQTEAGRPLEVVYTLRGAKVRVCSAYSPSKRKREAFMRRCRGGQK